MTTKKLLKITAVSSMDVTEFSDAQIEAMKAFTVATCEPQGITTTFELIIEEPVKKKAPTKAKDGFVEAMLNRVAELLTDVALEDEDEGDGNG